MSLQATCKDVMEELSRHPIYVHQLNWGPSTEQPARSGFEYSWHSTVRRLFSQMMLHCICILDCSLSLSLP
jgi:hypothetical protein